MTDEYDSLRMNKNSVDIIPIKIMRYRDGGSYGLRFCVDSSTEDGIEYELFVEARFLIGVTLNKGDASYNKPVLYRGSVNSKAFKMELPWSDAEELLTNINSIDGDTWNLLDLMKGIIRNKGVVKND